MLTIQQYVVLHSARHLYRMSKQEIFRTASLVSGTTHKVDALLLQLAFGYNYDFELYYDALMHGMIYNKA
jgi:hypothetical protein